MIKYLFVIVFFMACSNNGDSNNTKIDNNISRSSAISQNDNDLFIISEYTNEIIAYNTNNKSVKWKRNVLTNPKRLFYAKSLDSLAITTPKSAKIHLFNKEGDLKLTNDYFQQPFAIIWIESLQSWIVSDTGLNRIYITNQDFSIDYFLQMDTNVRAISYDEINNNLILVPFLNEKLYIAKLINNKFTINREILLNKKATFAQNIEIYKDEILIPHQRSNSDASFLRFDDIVRPLVSRYKRVDISLKINDILALHTIDKTVSKPIDIKVDSKNDNAWIVNANSNNISIINLKNNLLIKNLNTSKQPISIYINETKEEVYIYSSLSYSLDVFDLSTFELKYTKKLSQSIVSSNVQLGMEIFFDSTNPKAMKDNWLSCENCHPDGKGDKQIWQQGLGPRNTTSLEGILHTGMLHWTGNRDEIQDFEHTFRDLMKGDGFVLNPPTSLCEKMQGRSVALDAMADFLNTLKFPIPLKEHFYDINSSNRGKIIFESSISMCSSCHSGEYFTNSNKNSSILNDVGTFSRVDDTLSGPFLDTPSLRGVYFSAPYLHDSSATTLKDIFTLKNKNDLHGHTSHLNESELNDLIEYLKSL